MRVQQLMQRDLARPIEEIIKVDQTSEDVVHDEISEYIVTERIRDQYLEVLRAIADGKSEPTEATGVWISGFFGSGKSSFAKILGYILANYSVLGENAGELFCRQVKDERITSLVEYINVAIPTEVIMFDVAGGRDVRQSTERISELMYRNLLRALDYSENFEIAELEIDLEREDALDQFIRICEATYGPWRIVRKSAQSFSRASAILHKMDPDTYPSPDSWDRSTRGRKVEITVDGFVKRVFDLMAKRRPRMAVAFVIDEVGQYVARSEEKIEDLRVVAEKLGQESKNRMSAGLAPAPAWLIVTSQEKLEEVVAAIGSKRVQLAKLTDRFRHRVDLSPADIREVATRRVLSKRPEVVPLLQKLYSENEGLINTACQLERTTRWSGLKRDEFVEFYPYLPHFVELSIDIASGMRLGSGAPQHYGGSNRTMIKQAYEMLVSKRTQVGERPVGALVSVDLIFNLVEGNLPTEKQKDLSDIAARFAGHEGDGSWALRAAKAICLLEYVHDLPRTEWNLAALLVDEIGKPAPIEAVERALDALARAQFIRRSDDGWKLQTAQEKHWETERSSFLQPKPKDRNEIRREIASAIFDDPRMRAIQLQGLKTLRVGVFMDGVRIGEEGHVLMNLVSIADETELAQRLEEIRASSRTGDGQNQVHWLFALDAEIDDLVAQVHASRQMISKYEQLRARRNATKDEQAFLHEEVSEEARLKNRLKDKLGEAIAGGHCVFRGVAKDASALGRTLPEIQRAILNIAIPELYPKLEMGSCALGGDEARLVLRSANFSGLPQVFYDSPGGLRLIAKSGNKYLPNSSAPIAAQILGFIESLSRYGETVTGRTIEDHFSGIGYGWDRDVLKMTLAVLLRAGSIEITYQGRRYVDNTDPGVMTPFVNNTAFRATTFAPRRALDLAVLKRAVQNYEALTGDEVSMEEAAVSMAFKELCEAERRDLIQLEAVVDANRLPGVDMLKDYHAFLDKGLKMESDESVRLLADHGDDFAAMRSQIAEMRKALDKNGLMVIRHARSAIQEMWPVLEPYQVLGELANGASWLREAATSDTLYSAMTEVQRRSGEIEDAYRRLYTGKHSQRAALYQDAINDIEGHPHWEQAPEEAKHDAVAPLQSRACTRLELKPGSARCERCKAGIVQIESDILAVHSLESEALRKLADVCVTVVHGRPVTVVRAHEFFTGYIESEEDIETAVKALREYLESLLKEGTRIRVE